MNENKIQQQLDKVFEHIEIYNREMGGVQANLKTMCGDIGWIKTKLDKAITDVSKSLPTWATIAISILMGMLGIAVGVAAK